MSRIKTIRSVAARRPFLFAPFALAAGILFLQATAQTAHAGPADSIEQADAVYGSARAGHDAAAARYYRPQPDVANAAAQPDDATAARDAHAALEARYYRRSSETAASSATREPVRAEQAREQAAVRARHFYRPPYDENDPLRAAPPDVAEAVPLSQRGLN